MDLLPDLHGVEPRVPALVAGALLLAFGRRLYWFFAGVLGFVLGLTVGLRLAPAHPEWLPLLAGLLLGTAGALGAVFFQKVILAAGGFLAGGYAVLFLAQEAAWDSGPWTWVAALAGALVGVFLVRALFEIGLVVLSSLLGASLIVEHAGWTHSWGGLAFLGLCLAGILFQTAFTRRRRSRS